MYPELFNIDGDPYEQFDLAEKEGEIFATQQEKISEYSFGQ